MPGGREGRAQNLLNETRMWIFFPAVVKTRPSLRADYNKTESLNISSFLSLSVKGFIFIDVYRVWCYLRGVIQLASSLSIFQTELHQDQGDKDEMEPWIALIYES